LSFSSSGSFLEYLGSSPSLHQYAFILNSTNPFSLLVAKVKDFYFDFEDVNPSFIKQDLRKYYRSSYVAQS